MKSIAGIQLKCFTILKLISEMSETQTHLPFFWCSTYGHAKGEIKRENIKVYCCFSSVYIKCVMESFNVHSFTFSNQFIIVMCDDIFVSQLN